MDGFTVGDSVWFFIEDGGWHTGVVLGKERVGSGDFGMLWIEPNFLDKKKLLVAPKAVELIKTELTELLA